MEKDLKLIDFEELKKKIVSLKENRGVDLSTEEDLSIAVMNLISCEVEPTKSEASQIAGSHSG